MLRCAGNDNCARAFERTLYTTVSCLLIERTRDESYPHKGGQDEHEVFLSTGDFVVVPRQQESNAVIAGAVASGHPAGGGGVIKTKLRVSQHR